MPFDQLMHIFIRIVAVMLALFNLRNMLLGGYMVVVAAASGQHGVSLFFLVMTVISSILLIGLIQLLFREIDQKRLRYFCLAFGYVAFDVSFHWLDSMSPIWLSSFSPEVQQGVTGMLPVFGLLLAVLIGYTVYSFMHWRLSLLLRFSETTAAGAA